MLANKEIHIKRVSVLSSMAPEYRLGKVEIDAATLSQRGSHYVVVTYEDPVISAYVAPLRSHKEVASHFGLRIITIVGGALACTTSGTLRFEHRSVTYGGIPPSPAAKLAELIRHEFQLKGLDTRHLVVDTKKPYHPRWELVGAREST